MEVLYEVNIITEYRDEYGQTFTDGLQIPSKKRFQNLSDVAAYLHEQKISSCKDYDASILFGNKRVEGELKNIITRNKRGNTGFEKGALTFASAVVPLNTAVLMQTSISDEIYNFIDDHTGLTLLAIYAPSLALSFYNGWRISCNHGSSYGMELSLKPAKNDYSSPEVEMIKRMMKELKKYNL